LLPLVSFLILLLAGALRCALRPYKGEGGLATALYDALGGDVPGRGTAYISIAGIGLACVLSVTGFALFLADSSIHEDHEAAPAAHSHDHGKDNKQAKAEEAEEDEQHEGIGALRAKLA